MVCSPLSVLVESERNGRCVHNRKNLAAAFLCQEVDGLSGRGFRIQLWEREREEIIKGGSLGLQGKWLAVWFPSFIGTGADMWVHPPYWMNESLCVGGAPELLHSLSDSCSVLLRRKWNIIDSVVPHRRYQILSSHCTLGTNGVDWKALHHSNSVKSYI